MKKQKEESLQTVLEDVTQILNSIREDNLRNLEKIGLSSKQEKIIESIENDITVCVTKIGLVLHATEL